MVASRQFVLDAYDRGVMKMVHPSMGTEIFMLIDQPGVFLSAHGTPVSPDLARAAGFEVDDLLKAKELKDRMAAAYDQIAREMNAPSVQKKVIDERMGFKVVHIGMERYMVESPDGVVLTKEPLSKPQAKMLLKELTPEPEAPKEPVKK